MNASCISSLSYIKPQQKRAGRDIYVSCISSLSYIKPQPPLSYGLEYIVVFLPYPTSNRNSSQDLKFSDCVVFLPYPTSNRNFASFTLAPS